MIKIVVCSDNHGNRKVIEKILYDNQDSDYYFHLGDSEMKQDDLKPFISVKGNIDYDYSLPTDRVIDIESHSFYLTHSNYYAADIDLMANAAKLNGCDVVLFGHTHDFYHQTVKGIKFINPGSCKLNRSSDKPTYALIRINDDNTIDVDKIELEYKDIF